MAQHVSLLMARWEASLPWLLLLFLVLSILFCWLAYRLFVAAGKPQSRDDAKQNEEPEVDGESAKKEGKAAFLTKRGAVRRAFSQAVTFMRTTVRDRSLYGLPWYILLGERSAKQRMLMQCAGLEASMGGKQNPSDRTTGDEPVRWWFFNKGAVVDLDGTLVEKSADKTFKGRLFKYILYLLAYNRPMRPADGIILAVPVSSLVLEKGDESAKIMEEAVVQARNMYDRLCLVQRKLGMRLPVYMVLTRCEDLDGFAPLCKALSPEARNSMLGWSNPYTLETAYTPDWAEECAASVYKRMNEVELELFGHGPVDKANAVFTFPERLRQCFPALRVMLDKLFTPSAYHEAFMLRGVYFVGQDFSENSQDTSSDQGQTVFMRDLLERKVFAESILATPTSRAIRMGGRWAVALKTAIVLLLLGWGGAMGYEYDLLCSETRKATAVFQVVEQKITDPRFAILREKKLDRGKRLQRLILEHPHIMADAVNTPQSLFNNLVELNPQRFQSIIFPFSCTGRNMEDLSRAMGVAFDRVIMTSVDLGLAVHGEHLYLGRDPDRTWPDLDGDFPTVDQLPEFKKLDEYVRSSNTFSHILGEYHALNATGSVQSFQRVMQYALNMNPNDKQPKYHKFLQQALQGTQHKKPCFKLFREKAPERFKYLVNRLGTRLFTLNPVLPAIAEIEQSIDRLQASGSEQESDVVQQVTQAVHKAENVLALPSLEWMARSPFYLGPEYNTTMQMAGADAFIGETAEKDANQNIRKQYGRFIRKLKSYSTDSTGRILEVEQGVLQPRLAESVTNLTASFASLENLRFMESSGQEHKKVVGTLRLQPDIPPGTYPWWDVSLLEEAVSLLAPYDTFMDDGAENFPPEIRGAITGVTSARLGRSVMSLLVKAQGFRTMSGQFEYRGEEGSLNLEVRNFNQAGPYLIRLLDLFERLGMPAYHTSLASFTDLQTMRILSQTDQILRRERLFLPVSDGLSDWDGMPPAAPRIFGLSDLGELKSMFVNQADRLGDLAFNYAEPALAYLYQRDNPSRVVTDALVAKWEVILREVDGYQNKRPGNAVLRLQNFLLDGLKTYKAVDLLTKNSTLPQVAQVDSYFDSCRKDMTRALNRQSLVLCIDDFSRRYSGITSYFNSNLSGYFPFSGSSMSFAVPSSLKYAAPDLLSTFLAMLDKPFWESARVLNCDGLDQTTTGPVRDFLEHMQQIGEFLGPYGPNSPAKVPQLTFTPVFRTLRGSEFNANQLINWTFEAGGRETVYPDVEQSGNMTAPLLWTSGQSVGLTLRWARNSPFLPVLKSKGGTPVQTDNTTISWAYTGPWALLAFIQDNKAVSADLSANTPQGKIPTGTLAFSIPTRFVGTKQEQRKDSMRAAQEGDSQIHRHLVRVFMKVDFQREVKGGKPTAKPVELSYPDVFPRQAPPALGRDLLGSD